MKTNVKWENTAKIQIIPLTEIHGNRCHYQSTIWLWNYSMIKVHYNMINVHYRHKHIWEISKILFSHEVIFTFVVISKAILCFILIIDFDKCDIFFLYYYAIF